MNNINKNRILIVDDDAILALMGTTMLEKEGYEVHMALTGEEAVEIIKDNENIYLILMDVDLGSGIDGFEAAKRILEIRDLPVIFLTSKSGSDVLEQIKSIPCCGLVVKDSDSYYLFSLIAMALELYELRENSDGNTSEKIFLTDENEFLKLARDKQLKLNSDLLFINTELQKSEKKFRSLLDLSPSAVIICQKNKLEYTNQMGIEITGYSEKELLDMNFWDIVNFEYQPAMYKSSHLRELPDNNKTSYEFSITSKDGIKKWVSLKVDFIIYQSGPAALIHLIDITEKIKTANAVVKLDAELQKARSNIRKLACFSSINSSMSDDLSEEDFCKKVIENLIEAMQFSEAAYPIIRLDGKTITPEKRKKISGKNLTAEINYKNFKCGYLNVFYTEDRPFMLPEEQILLNDAVSAIEIFLSIKRNAEKLKESEARFKTIFEQEAVGVCNLSLSGDFLQINQRLCDITGFTPSELLGLNLSEITYSNNLIDDIEKINMLLEGEIRAHSVEKLIIRKDKGEAWVNLTLSLIKNPKGRPDNFLGVVEDITARKKIEEELEKQSNHLNNTLPLQMADLNKNNNELELSLKEARDLVIEAESFSNAKSRFLANMSHEIRTPLNGIMGLLSLIINSESELDITNRKYAEIAFSSGETLLQIVNEILDLSKIENQKIELVINNFNIQKSMDDIMEMLDVKAKEKCLMFNFNIDNRIPRFLKGDSGRLRQIVTNLSYNAIKFTDQGSVDVMISLLNENETDVKLMFEFTDTGIGIPDNQINKLFAPFSQISGKEGDSDGTGLGLSISKNIVELLNGDIGVESSEGVGSRFWFTVVLQKQKRSVNSKSGKSFIDTGYNDKGNSAVLIVEDNILNQFVAVSILKKLGYKTDIAASGNECIDILKKKEYSLVLMDCQMPEMDGFETTKKIRDNDSGVINPGIVIIALTAHAMDGYKEQCIEAGMNDYISKPVTIKKVEKILYSWVNRETDGFDMNALNKCTGLNLGH